MVTFGGSRSDRVMRLAASWLPRMAKTGMPAMVSRRICAAKNRPVPKSGQSPS